MTKRYGIWLGYKISSLKNKKISAAREWAWQHDEREEEETKHRAEKKDEPIGRFKLFLLRVISTLHEFSCTCNAVYVHGRNRARNLWKPVNLSPTRKNLTTSLEQKFTYGDIKKYTGICFQSPSRMQSLGVQKLCSANAFSDTKWVISFASFYWLRDFLLEDMKLNSDHVRWNVWTNIKKFYARNNIFKKKNSKNEILNHLCFDTKFVILGTALWRFNCFFFNFSSSANHGCRHFWTICASFCVKYV